MTDLKLKYDIFKNDSGSIGYVVKYKDEQPDQIGVEWADSNGELTDFVKLWRGFTKFVDKTYTYRELFIFADPTNEKQLQFYLKQVGKKLEYESVVFKVKKKDTN